MIVRTSPSAIPGFKVQRIMKRPLFPLQPDREEHFYPTADYAEAGSQNARKIHSADDIKNDDLRAFYTAMLGKSLKEDLRWIADHADDLSDSTYVVSLTDNGDTPIPQRENGEPYHLIFVKRPLNTIYHLDHFLHEASTRLATGGYIYINCRTSSVKKQVIYNRYPKPVARIYYYSHYVWHRAFPKLKLTNPIYFAVTKGRNRTLHRVEVLGRMYRAGFEVVDESAGVEYRAILCKVKEPITGDTPSTSPIAKLKRVGKGGKEITVYKFRTMYSYSEYLQPYIYATQQLDDEGKFAKDYRINTVGAFLRRTWLDELPMIINILKGEMKLVGVRPLSHHYFSLYTPEMQQLRTLTKPGLLPPFYYEKEPPHTLEEIQESERRYIEAYIQHPLRTDWHYFWGIMHNIFLRNKRSH